MWELRSWKRKNKDLFHGWEIFENFSPTQTTTMVRLTDQEILQKNLEEAYNSKLCTFTVTKFGSVFFNERSNDTASLEQDNYQCLTCTTEPEKPYIVCVCCYTCHRLHNITKLKKSSSICQCGMAFYEDSITSKFQHIEENADKKNDLKSKKVLCKVCDWSSKLIFSVHRLFQKLVYFKKFTYPNFYLFHTKLSKISSPTWMDVIWWSYKESTKLPERW